MSPHSIDVDDAGFQQEVIEQSFQQPVLVDFWAPWCGPCRSLKPILEKLADEYGGRFRLAKVNSDDNPAASQQFGVRSIPNVKAFVNGELVDEFLGAQPESAVRDFIDGLLPGPADLKRQEAHALLAAGDAAGAVFLLEEALTLEPRSDRIRVDLAFALFSAGRADAAAAALDRLGPLAAQDPGLAPDIARVRLAIGAAAGGDVATLEARIAADAGDLDARLALARLLVAQGSPEPGLEQLLEIIRRDRKFGDDVGRRTMVQVFDLLGPADPLVPRYRRALAAALN